MKRLQHVLARKHLLIVSTVSAVVVALIVVLAVTLSSSQRATHGRRSAAAELLMVRPSTAAATPLVAENAAARIDKLQQHVSNDSSVNTEKQAEAAALVNTAKHRGWSLKQYYAQLLNKQLLPTVQEQCQGFVLPDKQQLPPLQPATDKKPNFIYLLIDDMGYDDLHMHHSPIGGMHSWVKTPHLDKIVQQSLEFTNFYTTPMCSTSRAELLTGRCYPRTGSMYVNSGWDFMNYNETHMGEIFSAAGYKTAHFGKWHNGRTAGYMPGDAGFVDTYEPTPYVHYENLFTINGKNIQTKGWMEDRLMDYALQYLTQREADGKPFLMYYPTFSVHAGWMTMDHAGPRYQRPAPSKYLDKFLAMPLSQDTAHLYAMLEHIDDQIGRLMQWLDQSGLAKNTYVFLGGDNGPALFGSEQRPVPKEVRMPSGMQGSKHEVKEGGIRNFLAVRGPGVPQGTSTDVLTALVDVIPTLVDMAGIKQVISHAPWDGISFANIIRGQAATAQQQERMYITMETQCTEDDFLPQLGSDRHVLKPQPLLDYTTGGVSGLGFKRCIGVRYKNYKWLADASDTKGRGAMYGVGGKEVPTGLYKFHKTSHVELGCQEVSKSEPEIASRLEAAAGAWWQDMVRSAHSFERVTFFLGLGNKPVANVVTDGAIQRTPGNVQVVPMGVSGFQQAGDASWYRIKVATAGVYDVTVYHQSNHKAKFKIWVGPHDAIKAGTAMHLDATLDATAGRTALILGSLKLPQTPAGHTWELKLEMVGNSAPGKPAVTALDVIVFKLQSASGEETPVYQPDLQEGVKAWKIKNGYAHLQSMEPVATLHQAKQGAVVKEVVSPQDQEAVVASEMQGDR